MLEIYLDKTNSYIFKRRYLVKNGKTFKKNPQQIIEQITFDKKGNLSICPERYMNKVLGPGTN